MVKSSAHPRYERAPTDAVLLARLKIFNTTRWFLIAGVIGSALVATLVFDISFPALPVYVISAFMIIYNGVMTYQVRRIEELPDPDFRKRASTLGIMHIALDLLSFALILHYTGGVENPFIFLVCLHIGGASTILGRRAVTAIASLALLLVLAVVTLEFYGVLPHQPLVGFINQGRFQEPSFIIAVLVALAAILYFTAFMVTSISGELNRRYAEIVKLRENLLEERTEELSRVSTEVSNLKEERDTFLHFLGAAAHDLKAPLNTLLGYFRLMLEGYAGDLNATQKFYLEKASARTLDLLSLIKDLLDIPRVETGRLITEMTEISFPELVQKSLADVREDARGKGIAFDVVMPRTLSRVCCSESGLLRVLINLGANSVNYTEKGGVTCRVSENAEEIKVEFIDTGIGIPAVDLPHMFQDFFRAGNAPPKGTGLGLSLSKRIVEAHGGRIWVESPVPETGTGSRFVFTLPLKPPVGAFKEPPS
jgi:signal transduction histidine kinase